MTGSTFDGKAGGQPSNCSLTGPDEKGMYTLSVNEPFFPGRSRDEFQEVTTGRMEVQAPALQQVPFRGRDDRVDYARMAEMAYGSPRDSAIVRETLTAVDRQAAVVRCSCACHEAWGGGSHPGERCVCNGGSGVDGL